MRTLSVLSIIFSLVFLSWYVFFVNSNGRISAEEFSMVGIAFVVWSVLFSVIAAVHAFRKPRNRARYN
jgi:ABC-type thiamin/hydroxymethylpyrimidine transport system permease subunit